MKIDQYCQRQRCTCKHVELEQFLAFFCVVRVCQRQLGFLVQIAIILVFVLAERSAIILVFVFVFVTKIALLPMCMHVGRRVANTFAQANDKQKNFTASQSSRIQNDNPTVHQ